MASRRPALLGLPLVALAVTACSAPYVAPLLPSPYVERIDAPYDLVWTALVRVMAQENVQIQAIARDSGIIASEAVPTTIGLYADCGRFGDTRVEGDARVAYTVFVRALSPTQTSVQVNTRMRTETYSRRGGRPRDRPPLACASTGRWEANLIDTVRALLPRP
ncbi:MAG TPA: hypothetical protein VLD61_04065 [Methylomirabilota bacterium]|nr:hypothetical protein [Methylomirabilota bacterium]